MIKVPSVISQHRQAWLWKPVYNRLHNLNKMYSAVFVGEPGSGKSWSALSIAFLLDRSEDGTPRFDISRICFSASEFAELVAKNLPKGSAIVFDDSGLSLYSRESMMRTVRLISKCFQSIRYRNYLIFLTLPSLGSLDKGVRELLNGYFEPLEINFEAEKVKCKFHRLQTNPKSGKIYSHRPTKVEHGLYPDGYPKRIVKTVDAIWIDRPPEELTMAYEAKKKTYLDDWNAKNLKTIKAEEAGKQEKINPFDKYYALVVNNKQKYAVVGRKKLFIDMTKIMRKHPDCSSYTAGLIARAINRELKAKRK